MIRTEISPAEGALFLLNTAYYESRRIASQIRYVDGLADKRFRHGFVERNRGTEYLPQVVINLLEEYPELIIDPERASILIQATAQIVSELKAPRPTILQHRYGLIGGKLLSLEATGLALPKPLSKERTRQLEYDALRRLRRPPTPQKLIVALESLYA
jgi:hypothetical protein